MKKSISRRKRWSICLSTFMLVAIAILLIIYYKTPSVSSKTPDVSGITSDEAKVSRDNIKIDDDVVKIYIGSYINNFKIAQEAIDNPDLLKNADANKYIIEDSDIAEKYKTERKEFLIRLNETRSNDVFKAVVLLNKYCTVEDINEFIKTENVNVTCVYLWIPGETGRIRMVVKENNIEGALTRHFDEFEKKENVDDQMKADYNRIMSGDFGIFCVVIDANAIILNNLQNNKIVDFIDVWYNPDAENIAQESGKSVQYIELPLKPDGAY